jgi:predicted Zn-dependent peptidase
VTAEQAFAGARARVRLVGARSSCRRDAVEAAAAHATGVSSTARVGADRDPRRQHRPAAQATPTFSRWTRAKILGGEGGNRLHRVLRSERGLTYGAGPTMAARKDSGHIVADTDTRSETTAEALRLIVDEIAPAPAPARAPARAQAAQAYLTGSYPLTIETPGAIATQILNAVVYGLDLEELETYRERVNAITPDDIQRVARSTCIPIGLSIVLVGDATTRGPC